MNTNLGEMQLPQSAVGTMNALLFFDDLFDSFNGKNGQGLSSIISINSQHVTFWQEALQKLHKMEYVDKENHKAVKKNAPKCLKNWMWTIRGTIQLWKTLKKSGFSSLNLKHINQDLIENNFSQIRDHGHRNNNPSPYQFCSSFKMLVYTNLTSKKTISSNCEDNKEGTSLALLQMFHVSEIALANEEENVNVEYAKNAIPEATSTNIYVDFQKVFTNIGKNVECSECEECLKSERVLESLRQAVEILELRFSNFCHERKVKEKLIHILSTEIFTENIMHCCILQQALNNEITQEFITAWCRFINKILTGKIQEKCYTNFIYNEAKKIAMRYRKKD